jgi:uncharacterized delta-60 repeat protein
VSRLKTPLASASFVGPCGTAWRWRRLLPLVMLAVVAMSMVVDGQGTGGAQNPSPRPGSAGLLVRGRDGTLLFGSGARLSQEAGMVDKLGSFLLGLGYSAPAVDSAGLCVMRFTPPGALDVRFGNGGVAVTPLLPLKNHNSATATAVLQDASGRPIVVGWRYLPTAMDSNVPVITAARYTTSGTLDTTFGERGIVTTRVDESSATQAFAAALDADGRLLVAGYAGGKPSDRRGAFDDWSVRFILLRYTSAGVLDGSFGDRGVASQALDPRGQDRQSGRDFLLYDYQHRKTAALVLDRMGRAVIVASNGEGPALLMRYTQAGRLDPTFGTAGILQTPAGAASSISSLLWDSEGRLLAAGTSGDSMILLRYSADGVIDSGFSGRGMSSTPMTAGMRVSAALHDREGRLLVVASGENGVHLARFDHDGMPDTTFGSGGAIHSAAGRRLATAAGLAVDEGGIPTVAALSSDGIFLMRYTRESPVELSVRSAITARP